MLQLGIRPTSRLSASYPTLYVSEERGIVSTPNNYSEQRLVCKRSVKWKNAANNPSMDKKPTQTKQAKNGSHGMVSWVLYVHTSHPAYPASVLIMQRLPLRYRPFRGTPINRTISLSLLPHRRLLPGGRSGPDRGQSDRGLPAGHNPRDMLALAPNRWPLVVQLTVGLRCFVFVYSQLAVLSMPGKDCMAGW